MNTHPFREPISDKHFDSWVYGVQAPFPVSHPNVEKAIELLESIDNFDGETMEYVISRLFMREQMLKQLIGTCDWLSVANYFDERVCLNEQQENEEA